MKTCSVAIVIKDEENRIKDCLETVKWADEIIIVDSFSRDKSLDICRGYTDKIFQVDWMGFSKTKDFAFRQATSDWILSLDADEKVTPQLQEEIKKKISLDNDEIDGYYIPRRNFYFGKWIKHGGCYPDFNLRLFRKGKEVVEKREVHERIDVDGKTEYLKWDILHDTYGSIEDYVNRMNRYSDLMAKQMFNEGRKCGISDLTLRPALTFFRIWILKLGILDGFKGLLFAGLNSYYVLVKYAKLWELRR